MIIDTDAKLDNMLLSLAHDLGLTTHRRKVRRPAKKSILPYDLLVEEAIAQSTPEQNKKLQQMLGLSWKVTKVAGLANRPVLVFLQNNKHGNDSRVMVIKPDGDFEVNQKGRRTVSATLPR